MWEWKFFGIELYNLVAWLFIYSFCGWVWECFYISHKEKKVVNRGYVTGPVCTIYGVGAITMYISLKGISEHLVLAFFVGAILATVLEYVTAVIMESLFKTSWWDYSDQKFNFQGRICLSSTIAWGAATVGLFTIFQPFVNYLVGLVPYMIGKILLSVFVILYVIDFTISTIAAADLSVKLQKMDALMEEFHNYLKETRVYTTAEEIISRMDSFKRNSLRRKFLKRFTKKFDLRPNTFTEQMSQLGMKGKITDEMTERFY
ncbi:MAG: hypothetical protein GX567_15070, partial [Clostridia bacterium]|nr:hypothetical protein [Clostridia bacterium]